jgi:hypothetical protein
MSQDKICPFQNRVNNSPAVFCIEEKCMAWGEWYVSGAYKDEYTKEGCTLLKKSSFNKYKDGKL